MARVISMWIPTSLDLCLSTTLLDVTFLLTNKIYNLLDNIYRILNYYRLSGIMLGLQNTTKLSIGFRWVVGLVAGKLTTEETILGVIRTN